MIGDHLLHGSNGKELGYLVEHLSWSKCDWGITEDLPKGVSGRL
jgi:hypothetical protein